MAWTSEKPKLGRQPSGASSEIALQVRKSDVRSPMQAAGADRDEMVDAHRLTRDTTMADMAAPSVSFGNFEAIYSFTHRLFLEHVPAVVAVRSRLVGVTKSPELRVLAAFSSCCFRIRGACGGLARPLLLLILGVVGGVSPLHSFGMSRSIASTGLSVRCSLLLERFWGKDHFLPIGATV